MTSLSEQLAETARAGAARRGPEKQAVFDRANAEIAAARPTADALRVGARAPDFTLPNHKGELVQLSTLLKHASVVISFYRGGWCPYCNLELRALQQHLPEIEAAGGRLIAISPQKPDGSLDTQAKNALAFDVLSDHDNRVARQFGLVFTLPKALEEAYRGMGLDLGERNGTGKFELPAPATFVVGRDGVIRHAFVDLDYTIRQEPSEIVRILKKI